MQTSNNQLKWRGLGGWNYYFILKFGLLWFGYLNFHPFKNLVFASFLLFPFSSDIFYKISRWFAIPMGVILLYQDTWLPGIDSIKSQGAVFAQFSFSYYIEIALRFINWNLLGAAFILLVAYLFINQWIRITVFTVFGLVWLNVMNYKFPSITFMPKVAAVEKDKVETQSMTQQEITPNPGESLDTTLSNFVDAFYKKEKQRRVSYPASLDKSTPPFHFLFVQVCSLAWADVRAVNQEHNQFWQQFDIIMDNFNGVASYSNPAALRLLNANCGQKTLKGLFEESDGSCYLMAPLKQLGFETKVMFDYNPEFANMLGDLQKFGGVGRASMIKTEDLKPALQAFYGGQIINDKEALTRWLKQVEDNPEQKTVTFFNLIPLHDGNRLLGNGNVAPFPPLVENLLEELNGFIKKLEASNQKFVVVFIGEHGRNYTGDSVQMSGLRDIPTPDITHVPAAIKFIGLKDKSENKTINIKPQISYLALSEILSRATSMNIFNESEVKWSSLVNELPETHFVSQNESATVVEYNGKYYIRLKGDISWVLMPGQ